MKQRSNRTVQWSAPSPRLLRTKAAAEYLSMSAGKLRNLVSSGRLRVIQDEGSGPWLYDVRDLDEYIDRYKTATPVATGVNGFDCRQ